MAINPKAYHQANAFLKAIEIATITIQNSKEMDNSTKIGLELLSSYSRNIIENGLKSGKLTSHVIKPLEDEFFTYWNRVVNQDAETFWQEIDNSALAYQRKSPIRELLKNGKLRFVEQWIDLFNNFNELEQSGFLSKQFQEAEIAQVKDFIETEEKQRFELINKYFQKKKIPRSQYLKFGESMAFMERCNLTLKYFSEKEREEIYEIWKSGK